MLFRLRFQVIDQAYEGIEADHARAIGDEVGESVDVVVVDLAVTVVNDVFHAADIDGCRLHDALDRLDDLPGRSVAFDFQAGFGRVHGAGRALQLLAGGGAADVGGAEVESLAGEMDFDAVEIFGADHFHSDNVSTAGGNELLHQRGVIESKIKNVRPDAFFQLFEILKLGHTRAAAANIGFHHDGEAQAGGGGDGIFRMVDDPAFGVGKSERFEQRKLQGFGSFVTEGLLPVDHALAALLQMGQIVKGVEDSLSVAAPVGRRAHAVEKQRVSAFAIQAGRIKVVLGGVDACEGHALALQLVKERHKPVRMFVINCDWLPGV